MGASHPHPRENTTKKHLHSYSYLIEPLAHSAERWLCNAPGSFDSTGNGSYRNFLKKFFFDSATRMHATAWSSNCGRPARPIIWATHVEQRGWKRAEARWRFGWVGDSGGSAYVVSRPIPRTKKVSVILTSFCIWACLAHTTCALLLWMLTYSTKRSTFCLRPRPTKILGAA